MRNFYDFCLDLDGESMDCASVADDSEMATKNCGTGAGGFKPGNTCGGGDGGSESSDSDSEEDTAASLATTKSVDFETKKSAPRSSWQESADLKPSTRWKAFLKKACQPTTSPL